MSKVVTVTFESDETPSRKAVATITYPGDDTLEAKVTFEPMVKGNDKAEYLGLVGLFISALKKA